jgi:hypothetical protein
MVPVFAMASGGFGWCVASERGPVEFRSERFASKGEAIEAVAAELRIGDR